MQTVESEIEKADQERAGILAGFEREPNKPMALGNRRLKELEQTKQKAEASWLDLERQIEALENAK